MTRPCRKHKQGPSDAPVPTPPVPAAAPSAPPPREPVMRRWPHPVEPSAPPEEPDLRFLLHRQTELLLEIRALLAGLTAEQVRRE